jgi:hypothetical protein
MKLRFEPHGRERFWQIVRVIDVWPVGGVLELWDANNEMWFEERQDKENFDMAATLYREKPDAPGVTGDPTARAVAVLMPPKRSKKGAP